jgi:crotonobetainyl-CoA:carnitine CoA-transferase CaiB-like acyl-CoA transferase
MLPLAGQRIIAVEQYGAGPFGTMLLADLGAELIKVESAQEGGDFGRRVGPYFFGPDDSEFFQSFNRNKRSITLNFRAPEARAVFRDLAQTADGVLDNLRGDKPAELGITYEALKDVNPKIVCAHLSAYGREGSRRDWPGFDYLMQAEAGYLSVTGEPDGPPARCGLSIVDLMTGVTAALALVSGIVGAKASGRGRDIDVSLFDVALQNLCYLATWYLNDGVNTGRMPRSGHPSIVPSQLYRTEDGWIFIMVNKENYWPALCAKIGRSDLVTDPAFATRKARLANRGKLTDVLDAVLMTRTTAAWLRDFAGEVPAAPVHDVKAALDNPFVRDEGRLARYRHPVKGEIPMLATPFRCPGETFPTAGAPALGADTDAILGALGYDAAKIAGLRQAGAI